MARSNRKLPALLLAIATAFLAATAPTVLGTALPSTAGGEETAAPPPLVFRSVRLFDGETVRDGVDVVIADGMVRAIGSDLEAPAWGETVDGTGRTLLPGLIDAHTHSWGPALERALVFGVTTQIDQFGAPELLRQAREEQEAGEASHRADLVSAGILATVPGGHGTQYGMDIPTLTTPEEAEPFVAARFAEGSDFLKIVIEDGTHYGRDLPTLSPDTVTALVEAAHRRDESAVAHVSTLPAARTAVAADIDGLVHLFLGDVAPPELVEEMIRREMFVVPTLTVLESTTGVASGASLADDSRLAPYLQRSDLGTLLRAFPAGDDPPRLAPAFASVRRLHAAGVPILAGSDAPNPGTAHGVSLHRELELLVAAGLPPVEALRAATSRPADAFRLADRGRVRPGLRADLVLVEGDPTADILATRAIVGVWKGGIAAERPRAELDDDSAPAPPAPGPVSDFEGDALEARWGFGWTPTTDEMMGGASTVDLAIAEGGAEDSGGALRISGEIRDGYPYPWAGAMFFPGEQPMAPADLSGAEGIRFWARGDGRSYRLMLFSAGGGAIPATTTFEAGDRWRRYEVPWSEYPGVSADEIVGVCFCAGSPAGLFELEIDAVSVR